MLPPPMSQSTSGLWPLVKSLFTKSRAVVLSGAIQPLCDILDCNDASIITIALETLENILKLGQQMEQKTGLNPYTTEIEECGGLDLLEKLQMHENDRIYKKSVDILEDFFGAEEDDQNLVPNSTEDAFSFGAPSQAGAIIPAATTFAF